MAHPLLIACNSSNVEAYLAFPITGSTDANLYVEFKSGKIYRYTTPLNDAIGMATASSKGQYLNQIKQQFNGVLITADELTAELKNAGLAQPAQKAKRKSKLKLDVLYKKYPMFAPTF